MASDAVGRLRRRSVAVVDGQPSMAAAHRVLRSFGLAWETVSTYRKRPYGGEEALRYSGASVFARSGSLADMGQADTPVGRKNSIRGIKLSGPGFPRDRGFQSSRCQMQSGCSGSNRLLPAPPHGFGARHPLPRPQDVLVLERRLGKAQPHRRRLAVVALEHEIVDGPEDGQVLFHHGRVVGRVAVPEALSE